MSNPPAVPLSTLADLTMGQSPEADWINSEDVGIPFLQGCAEFGSSHPETNVFCFPPLRVGKANSVLISVRAPVGTMNYADQDFCIGRGLASFQARSGISNTIFLKHAVEQNVQYLHGRSQGSTFAAISADDLRTFPIPSFRYRVQNKIALILSTLDTVIEKTEALIAKYQQIKTGLMHDLFTRGVLPDGQLRPPRSEAPELYKETEIGWIPKEWACLKLGALLQKSNGYLQTGPFGSQLHANEYISEGVPVVMPQDINDGKIRTSSIARISEARAKTLSRHELKLGDIIIARRGDLNRAAPISQGEVGWVCGTGCFLLRLGRTALNHFFFSHAYQFHFIQRQIEGMAIGTTMQSLNNSIMSRVFFPVPDPSEQECISARFDSLESQLSALTISLENKRAQKQGLMHDLLTGKVEVTVEPETGHA